MDPRILCFTSISIFICMFMAHKILTKKSISTTPKLPPGPWKLPITGNIHNLGGSLPHHQLRDLSTKYGPLMHLKLGEVSTIVVSSPEYAKEVMKTHDLIFASRPNILATKILNYDRKGIAFTPYGGYWRQQRKIFAMELLSAKRVQCFQPIREEVLNNFIQGIASKEGSQINLTKEVISTIFTMTSRMALGNKGKHEQQLISVIREAAKVAGGFDLADLYPSSKWLQHISGLKPKLEKLHQQADQILQNIVDEHRESKSSATQVHGEEEEVLLDVLLKEEFCLSDDSIKAAIWDIFGGGSDTSSATITWAMAEIIKNSRIMKKLQAEVREVFTKGKPSENSIENLKYLKCVVKETLRLHPPGPLLLPRESAQACEIDDYHIPVKSKVIINAWAIARDPNHWIEPERFYPERFVESCIDYKGNNFEFIPFGSGRRMCPGLTFGLTNVEYALALLMYHFDWTLPNGMNIEDLGMTEMFGITVTRKDDLYLIPKTFHPLAYSTSSTMGSVQKI